MTRRMRIPIYLLLIALLSTALLTESIKPWRDKWVAYRALMMAEVDYHTYENSWFGIRMQQFPSDFLHYSEIINELKPEMIIETGTFYGGNAVFLATVLQHVQPTGKVITIDIDRSYWDQTLTSGKIPPALLERIHFIEGDSVSDSVLTQVRELVGQKSAFVILDSLHTKDHVLKELNLYSEFVPRGSFLIVNDTHHDMLSTFHAENGPLAAVEAFLPTRPEFQVSTKYPRDFISASLRGFLTRIK